MAGERGGGLPGPAVCSSRMAPAAGVHRDGQAGGGPRPISPGRSLTGSRGKRTRGLRPRPGVTARRPGGAAAAGGCPAPPSCCERGPRQRRQQAAEPASVAQALSAESGPGEEEIKKEANLPVYLPVCSAGPPSPRNVVTCLYRLCKVAHFYFLKISDFYSN